MSAAAKPTTPSAGAPRRPPETPRILDDRAWGAARDMIPDGHYERCVGPILRAVGWRGSSTQIIEAMPHFSQLCCANDLRLALHHMGLRTSIATMRAEEIRDELLPALLLGKKRPFVVLGRAGRGVRLFDPESEEEIVVELQGEARLCRIHSHLAGATQKRKGRGWFRNALFGLMGEFGFLIALSLAINLLVLAPPLFTMGVYNLILPAETVPALALCAAAAIGAVALEHRLRRERALAIADATARITHSISTTGFRQVLSFPLSMHENAPVSTQINWLKQFDGIMSAYGGPVCAALLDLPFVLLLLLAVNLIGGPLVIPIIVALGLMIVSGWILAPAADRAARRATETKSAAGALLREMLRRIDSIRDSGAEPIWRTRVATLHREAVGARVRAAALSALSQNLGAAFITLSTIAVLIAGALMAMEGALSVGAMVATTMLAGRVFGPIQTIVLRAQALSGSRQAAKRYEALLEMEAGRPIDAAPAIIRAFEGRMEMRELSFRFARSNTFALRGIEATIEAGSVLGVVGSSGSGKTTLLKLMAGLYQPSSGAILLDGVNLSQLHAAERRTAVAYAPARPAFFYGAVAQNMRLAAPTAQDADLAAALETCGVALDQPPFTDGLDTRFSAQGFEMMSARLRQRLCLAQALVKRAPLMIFDTPETAFENDLALFDAILAARAAGSTVILASNMQETLRRCDVILGLGEGRMLGLKPASEALAPQGGR